MISKRTTLLHTVIVLLIMLSTTILTSCGGSPSFNTKTKRMIHDKLKTTYSLIENQPAPKLNYSLEREILIRRIKEWNDPNKMLYLYLFTPTNIVYMITVKGKLASTSKRLTPPFMKISCDKGQYYGECIVPAPDVMGVWGHSAPAKVGITTLNTLIEIGGFVGYTLTETPLVFSKEVKVIEIKLNK